MTNHTIEVRTIDTHTMGEATRIVIDGFPELVGETMIAKKRYVMEHYDYLRKLLMHEPRGHKDMFGAILTKPVNKQCDIGVVFMDSKSYLNMCGHGTIGTVTMCITEGIIEKKSVVYVDSPAGIIQCFVQYDEEMNVKGVKFNNVASFVLYKKQEIELENYGKVPVDIAFGGSFFGIISADDLQVDIALHEKEKLVKLALEAREKINHHLVIQHPTIKEINSVDLIEISKKISDYHYKNVVIFGEGQIDRSPCGTGTCAKMATLPLQVGEEIMQESIIGSTFIGKVEEKVMLQNYEAIIPSISGVAWITGEHRFILQKNDIFPLGFEV